jgi:Zinc knuckle
VGGKRTLLLSFNMAGGKSSGNKRPRTRAENSQPSSPESEGEDVQVLQSPVAAGQDRLVEVDRPAGAIPQPSQPEGPNDASVSSGLGTQRREVAPASAGSLLSGFPRMEPLPTSYSQRSSEWNVRVAEARRNLHELLNSGPPDSPRAGSSRELGGGPSSIRPDLSSSMQPRTSAGVSRTQVPTVHGSATSHALDSFFANYSNTPSDLPVSTLVPNAMPGPRFVDAQSQSSARPQMMQQPLPFVQQQASLQGAAGLQAQYAMMPGAVGSSPLIPLPRYVGRNDQRSPYDFLVEFERYARALGRAPEALLLTHMPVALEQEAARWWTLFGDFPNWNSFVEAFLAEFASYSYRQRLARELDLRTQSPDEPLSSFVQVIAEFYRRLGNHVPEHEKVARVLAQMHPEYRRYTYGRVYGSLRELSIEAVRIQDAVLQERMYRPPPTPSRCIEPSLAFGGNARSSDQSTQSNPLSTAQVSLTALDPLWSRLDGQYTAANTAGIAQNTPRERRPNRRSSQPSSSGFRQDDTQGSSHDRAPRRDNNGDIICFSCGQRGHMSRACPSRPSRDGEEPKNAQDPSQQ